MALEQAVAVLKYHQEKTWPGHSEVALSATSAQLQIRVGSETDPAIVVLEVNTSRGYPIIRIVRKLENLWTLAPFGALTDPAVLHKLGGTLIQAGNVVAQLIALGGPVGTVGE